VGKFSITLGLTRKQVDFLDGLLKSRGYRGRFGRATIIRALLNVAKELKIDVAGVKSEKQLKERITKSFQESS